MQRFGMKAFADFGRLWLLTFMAALAAAFGANLVFKIALNSVVDVLLAAQIFLMALLELYFAARLLLALVTGHLEEATARLVAMSAYLFLLSSSLLAFYAFAYFRDGTCAAHPCVRRHHEGVRRGVHAAGATDLGGHRLVTKGGSYVNYVNQIKGVLEAIYYLIGILVALPTIRTATRRREDNRFSERNRINNA